MEFFSKLNGKSLVIERKEIYRYLGYHFGGSVSPDPELEKTVDELEKKLKDAITPRCIYEEYILKICDDTCFLYSKESSTDTPVLSFPSKKLSAHLRDCSRILLFAATIGPGADMLIRRYSVKSSLKPAVLQATGAAAIESYADEITEHIREEYGNIKMRFSPGYGDFSLEHQKDFFNVLQLEKNLGISLNKALLMTPSKSITAVIGIL